MTGAHKQANFLLPPIATVPWNPKCLWDPDDESLAHQVLLFPLGISKSSISAHSSRVYCPEKENISSLSSGVMPSERDP